MSVRPLAQFPFDRRNPDLVELFLYLGALAREQGTRLSLPTTYQVAAAVQLPLSVSFKAHEAVFVEFNIGLGDNTALAISTVASIMNVSIEVDGISYANLLTPIEVDRVTAGPTKGTISFTAMTAGTLLFVADLSNPLGALASVNEKSYVRYY